MRELLSMVMELSEQNFDTGNGTQASMFTVDKFDVSNKTVKWEKDGKKFTSKLEGYSVATRMDQVDRRPIVMVDLTFNNKFYTDVIDRSYNKRFEKHIFD